MRSTELKVNEENLIKTLKGDIFDRNEDIKAFIGILNNIEGNYSIALDGAWGSGKSFFVNHVKMVLDTQNDLVENSISDEDVNFIKYKFKEKTLTHLTIYYDAWANDNDTDPIISLIYEIIKQTSNANIENFNSYKFDAVNLLKATINTFTGSKFNEFMESLTETNFLDEIQKEKNIQTMINDFLSLINVEIADRTVIFIDELDRCKPTYAIKLLERIKHYFINENITFVFSMNKKELQHTLKNCYGEGFNAMKYLEKFFDLEVELPAIDLDVIYRTLGINNSDLYKNKICMLIIKEYNFQLRETYKFIDKINILKKQNVYNEYDYTAVFLNDIMAPFLIGLKIYDGNIYYDFINDKNSSSLLEIFNNKNLDISFFKKYILKEADVYDEMSNAELDERIIEMYNYIFNFEGYIEKGQYKKIIGKISINKNTKTELLDIINLKK